MKIHDVVNKIFEISRIPYLSLKRILRIHAIHGLVQNNYTAFADMGASEHMVYTELSTCIAMTHEDFTNERNNYI